MKKLLFIISLAISFNVHGQNIIKHSPYGFDTPRNDIRKGKIDTIAYFSKTVGIKRKALGYTPPSYTKTRKYPTDIHGLSGEITCLILHNYYLNSPILNKLLQ